jgi:F0F1-type ATP synthase assembly protein I
MLPSQPQYQPPPPWTRLAGIGFEFGASIAVFMLLGYWVDRHWGIQRRWGLLVGTLLGLVGGTYNFIRETRRAVRQTQRHGTGQSDPSAGAPPGPGGQGQC